VRNVSSTLFVQISFSNSTFSNAYILIVINTDVPSLSSGLLIGSAIWKRGRQAKSVGKFIRARVSDPAAAELQLHLKGKFAEKFLGGNRTRGESQTTTRLIKRSFNRFLPNGDYWRMSWRQETSDRCAVSMSESRHEKGPCCCLSCHIDCVWQKK